MKLWLRICYLCNSFFMFFSSFYPVYYLLHSTKPILQVGDFIKLTPSIIPFFIIGIIFLLFGLSFLKINKFTNTALFISLPFLLFSFLQVMGIFMENTIIFVIIAFFLPFTIIFLSFLIIGLIISIKGQIKSKNKIN